ncbi:hypothetical protein [Clostridium chauvoei]|uniref:Uncharacterized protein n=5 Tax=Clostridium chauvoei TaxID=46867 RepID=S6ERC7_9CLOT|nr:hypothetical protein [Clostridium chauvoei]ATD55102.1 hypothetical protein BTM20_07560 [Clostridium chauvoei]ATD57224.1 hypothetical protein BTM21_05495 [Clostridium chauvoei]MBX7279447.1 hypothetical protein [Clostridium chauvoei]MBX7282467.1 hypothetical protein [Clostridium chauvoei]MBX7285646.1 hypothetical protein [Clostridium chauvoei]
MNLNEKHIEEKIKHLKKAIEIVGGIDLLENKFKNQEDLFKYIIETVFKEDKIVFEIQNTIFTIKELMDIKIRYEKHLIKNRSKVIQSIVYKINKYNTALESLVRKYKKSNSISEYNEIKNQIIHTYRMDINLYILKEINEVVLNDIRLADEVNFYGEYLTEKREQLVISIMRNIGAE